ncbi:ABC transporter ATP-binding protein [Leucobacter luti]|uniref:Putative ABC transport system ATP-binding protein n=1 Tax=Leucobacter luti TaxID=340320 RepID=A0A4Q7U5F5_9MICO|nr:ABC transporter ATP-binding protein [Leucobacter luti]RZT68844.1 putative ABC transport system ATP-binding protein [Leucobacter luti]
MAAFELRALTKVYGSGSSAFRALRGVSLTTHPAESLAIVGESGSGKSTLLNMMGLLDAPTSGTVSLDGVDLTRLRAGAADRLRNREFGFVFQSFHLDPRMSAVENVTVPLRIAGASRGARARATAALDAVGLADRAGTRADTLSGGQQQRVAIARALVTEPRVLFADEPTGALDSETGEAITETLFALHRGTGASLIIVTHSSALAARCDRVVTIRDGAILSDTAPEAEAMA